MEIKKITEKSKALEAFEKREWHIADLEHYGRDLDFTKRHYKFTMEEGEEILGLIEMTTELKIAFVDTLLVGHQHRRKGVGAALLAHAEEVAKDEGCTKIWLDTNEDWEAKKFYEKQGYEITGRHEKHIDGKTSIFMTKFF